MTEKRSDEYRQKFVEYHAGKMQPDDAEEFRKLQIQEYEERTKGNSFLKLFFDNYFEEHENQRQTHSTNGLMSIALSAGHKGSQNQITYTLQTTQCNWLPECPKSLEAESATVEFRQLEGAVEVSVTGFLVGKFQSKLALNWYDQSGELLYRGEAQNEFVPVVIVTGPVFPLAPGRVDICNRFEDENGVIYFVLARLNLG